MNEQKEVNENNKGLSELLRKTQEADAVREALKNDNTKKETLDYIFGKSKDNPLKEIRKAFK